MQNVFKLSPPQVNVNANTAELQLHLKFRLKIFLPVHYPPRSNPHTIIRLLYILNPVQPFRRLELIISVLSGTHLYLGEVKYVRREVLYQGHKYQTKSQQGKEGNMIFPKMLHQAEIEPAELAVEIAKCQTNSENSDILYDSVIIFTHSIEYNNDIILLEYNNVCHTKLLKLPRQITSVLAYTMLQNIL